MLRVATAVVAIPLVLLLDRIGGWPFAVALAVIAAAGTYELCTMGARADASILTVDLAAAAAFAVVPFASSSPERVCVGLVAGLIVLVSAILLLPGSYTLNPLTWLTGLTAPLYVGLLLGFIGLLRQVQDGAWWVLVSLVITWGYDTGAYLTGRAIGKRPFMAHVSPKKTVEGVVGGLVVSGAAGLIAVPAVGLAWWQAAALGLTGGAAGQVGDLVESMLKRQAGVKDSGAIFPGHGGVLDRIDSVLFVGPWVYYAALLLGHAS